MAAKKLLPVTINHYQNDKGNQRVQIILDGIDISGHCTNYNITPMDPIGVPGLYNVSLDLVMVYVTMKDTDGPEAANG